MIDEAPQALCRALLRRNAVNRSDAPTALQQDVVAPEDAFCDNDRRESSVASTQRIRCSYASSSEGPLARGLPDPSTIQPNC
jgi:hypothetical protein